MNVVGLENGRITLLLDILELSPAKGIFATELVAAIQERYRFAVLPKLPTKEAPAEVLRFEHGRFPLGQEFEHISLFEIHQQGLIIEAVDTQTCDSFLSDLFETGQRLFGLRKASRYARKLYSSAMVVAFENDISSLIGKWDALSGLASSYLKSLYEVSAPAGLHRIALKADPERLPTRLAGLMVDFTLERRIFMPHESQRFFAAAPLPTDKHMEFLQKLDDMVLQSL